MRRARGQQLRRSQPTLRGSYCGGSDQDLAPPTRAGCARISGYIAAGARFGSDERIGGRPDPFAPIGEPAIVGSSGVRPHDCRRAPERRPLFPAGEPRRHRALRAQRP